MIDIYLWNSQKYSEENEKKKKNNNDKKQMKTKIKNSSKQNQWSISYHERGCLQVLWGMRSGDFPLFCLNFFFFNQFLPIPFFFNSSSLNPVE